MLECLRTHNNGHTLSCLYSELRGKRNRIQNIILLLIKRMWLLSVHKHLPLTGPQNWIDLTIHSPAGLRHLPYKASSMKEQRKWVGRLLPKAKRWTTYAQFFSSKLLVECSHSSDVGRFKWGDTDKLKTLCYSPLSPLSLIWNLGDSWPFGERDFFLLKYKNWQVLGEVKDLKRVSFPILLPTTLSTGNPGKPQIGDCGTWHLSCKIYKWILAYKLGSLV